MKKTIIVVGQKGAFKNFIQRFNESGFNDRLTYTVTILEPDYETTVKIFPKKEKGFISDDDFNVILDLFKETI